MTENENTTSAAIEDDDRYLDTEDTDVCPGCGFSKFAAEELCVNCRREASSGNVEESTWGRFEPDHWCHHCKQNVFLTQGRHLCPVALGYLFGIELEPARRDNVDGPRGIHACPNGHMHEGGNDICAECEHRECCAA